MISLRRCLATVIFLVVISEVNFAHSQSAPRSGQCSAYSSIVLGGAPSSVPVIPTNLLTDLDAAIPCLIGIIQGLDGSVGLPVFKPEIRSQFLSATGALRSIISAAISADELAAKQASQNSSTDNKSNAENATSANKNLLTFIRTFRRLNNTTVARVLAYAIRSDDPAARSNALLILANVIDDRTVCVAIDHLYDSKIGLTPYGIKGRANLLAVISVVAPWAYRETYANIEDMLTVISASVSEIDPALQVTRDIVANIRERLSRQTKDSNQAVCLPADSRDCYRYPPEWAKKEQLRYPDKANKCGR